MKATLAIVLLNYNGEKHLATFLPNLVKYADGHSIIVIDNCSTDTSINFIQNNFPNIELHILERNFGFAAGYNEGLTIIQDRFDHYLLLNTDVEVSENFTKPLLTQMLKENTAACQPKILSYTKPTHFEHAGASGGFLDINSYPFCRGRIMDQCEEDKGQYDAIIPIHWASGAAILLKADLFHEIGGFDADFFAHMEEIDMCWRIRNLGYEIVCVPESVVYHLGGGTMPYDSPLKLFLNFRNNLLMILKNHYGFWGPRIFIRMCLDGIAGIHFIFKGKFSSCWMVFLAHMSFYRHFKTTLSKRKMIKRLPISETIYKGNLLYDYYIKGNKSYSKLNKRLF